MEARFLERIESWHVRPPTLPSFVSARCAFERQIAALKPLMGWSPETATWQIRISGSHSEHVSDALNVLFEVARTSGTAVTVRLVPSLRDTTAAAS